MLWEPRFFADGTLSLRARAVRLDIFNETMTLVTFVARTPRYLGESTHPSQGIIVEYDQETEYRQTRRLWQDVHYSLVHV